ncbi:unnamed protein product [Linum trigynum]|uniref:Reverse transcriptase domain-containing protein n=1 Tax=Linum trigynum TaxID=586398 RepID=A0AAV2DSJ4_9ROSI
MSTIPIPKEIKANVMSKNGTKVPGKDGSHVILFQKCSEHIGTDSSPFIIYLFTSPGIIREINETLLTLIPKVDALASTNQFRPISLWNVTYKVVAKCIANMLKALMPHLVHLNKSSFVTNRHIIDNIVIFQETVHSMPSKLGKKGYMLLKVDIAKAYNKIVWDFMEETLTSANIPNICIIL